MLDKGHLNALKYIFFNSTQTEVNANSPGASHFSTRYPNDFQIFFFLNFQLFILTKYLLAVPYILIIFQGYILIEDFFDVKKELDPVREAINTLVDDLAKKLYDAGKIKSKQILYGNFLSLKNYATITCKYTFMVKVILFKLV